MIDGAVADAVMYVFVVIIDAVATNAVLLDAFPTHMYPFAIDAVKEPAISKSPLPTISRVTNISRWKLPSVTTTSSPNDPVLVRVMEPVVIELVVKMCSIDSIEPDFLKNTLPSYVLMAISPKFNDEVPGTFPVCAERLNTIVWAIFMESTLKCYITTKSAVYTTTINISYLNKKTLQLKGFLFL